MPRLNMIHNLNLLIKTYSLTSSHVQDLNLLLRQHQLEMTTSHQSLLHVE